MGDLLEHLKMVAKETDTHSFTVEREPQEGLSFSLEAMELVKNSIAMWIGANVMERWERTGEPPTVLDISVKVTVS